MFLRLKPEILIIDRAVIHTVSRRLPMATVWIRSRIKSCGICGGQSDTGEIFSEYFGPP
jgi:hypothetical protein